MLLHLILEHIREIDARKLWADRAYSSMFHYMTGELGYSSSAAMRRLNAARMLNSVPTLAAKIQQGEVNLTQVGELSRAIKEKEKSGVKISDESKGEILNQISGLNSEQTQKIVAMSLDIELKDPERVRVQKDDSVHLSITLTREQYDLLASCKDKAVHSLQLEAGDYSWARVIEVVAGQYLDGKSFSSKVFSRSEVQTQSESNSPKKKDDVIENRRDNKTLTLKTRRFILNRDKCCQYEDKLTGKKCNSTYGLQVDHIIPQWCGGSHAPENLQVLCGPHNNLKYRNEAGIKLQGVSSG
jgi:5-methylcytosine-specific restriction endonuclease McrA